MSSRRADEGDPAAEPAPKRRDRFGDFFRGLDGRLLPWLGPPPLGPYDEPEPPAVADRGCPMCGRPMSEHEYGQVGQRVTVRCPARNDSV